MKVFGETLPHSERSGCGMAHSGPVLNAWVPVCDFPEIQWNHWEGSPETSLVDSDMTLKGIWGLYHHFSFLSTSQL